MGVRGTPTFFVGRLVGNQTVQLMRKVSGLQTTRDVERVLREALPGHE
jgi:protein-disulfide isomerase